MPSFSFLPRTTATNLATSRWRMGSVVFCLFGTVLLACEGDATGLDENKRIGPEGGTAILADGSVKLFIPPGALSEEIWFTVTPAYSVPASDLFVARSGWEIGPPGTSFKRPITLTIAYDPAGVPEGVGEEGLGVFKVAGNDWALAPNTWASPGDHSTSGDVTSLGRFGVNGLAVAAVEVSPDTAALAPQGTIQFQAMPKAENGRPLTSRPVSWETSDSTRATVTPSGRVTALSEGSVTITASSGGESATAAVSVRIPVATVEISPPSGSLSIGQILQLAASGRDAGGNILPGREIDWSSSAPSVATVDESGRVTAIGLGSASIIASIDGRKGSATIGVHAPLAVSTAVLAPGVVNEAYSQTLAATGGDGTYIWSVDEVALPEGLSLNPSTGVLGGAPTSEGTSFFKVWVESAGRVADKTLSIHVSPVPVASVVVLPATVSLIPLQSQQLTAVARDAYGRPIEGQPVSWASGDGNVVSVSSSGVVTARNPGSTTITATIGGHPGWASVSVTDVLSVSDSSMASGVLGQPYSHTLSYQGGTGQNAWTVLAGDLPPGLTLDSETGEVGGAPSALGLTSFIIQVTSSDGQTATRSLSIRVFEALVTTTGALEDGIAGDMYGATLAAVGGDPPYLWSLGSDTLPTGLTLSAADGVISGIPLFEGAVSFTVEVASRDGQTASEDLSISVHAVPAASVEVSPSSATTPVGGTQQLTATVRDASGTVLSDRTVFWTSSNTAVASVDINGLVTGVGIGSSTITANVDEVSDISTITVYETLQIITDALADGVVGTAYSQALAATGGDGTYGWTMTAGSLPPGLSLDGSTGLITGTPAVAGNSMFIVQVFSGGQSVQKLLTISVG